MARGLGIARKFFADNAPLNGFLDACIATLERRGRRHCRSGGFADARLTGAPEQEVLLYEFKADLNAYLRRLPPTFPVRSLAALIRFNEAHKDTEMPLFDQELLRQAEAKGPLTEKAYKDARAACLKATRSNGIDAVLAEHKLDAMVTLTAGPAWLIDTRQRRLRYRRLFLARCDRRISAHYRSGGPVSRIAGWLVVLRRGLQRTDAHQVGFGIRGGGARRRRASAELPEMA